MKNQTICILILSLLIVIPTSQLFSQHNDRPLLPLSDEDFTCFQTVDCVLSSDELTAKGWSFTMDESVTDRPRGLTFNMKGANVLLSAAYSKEGNLIHAKYQLFDRPVPSSILNVLSDGDYDEWVVIKNTFTVRNFDPATTEFVLELKKGELSETVTFNLSELETEHSSVLASDQLKR